MADDHPTTNPGEVEYGDVEPDPGNSERDEDNEGAFEVDTDKLRVKPEDGEDK